MKKILYFIIVILAIANIVCIFFSCQSDKDKQLQETRVEHYSIDYKSLYYTGNDLDSLYRISTVYRTYKGITHEYTLYEVGTKGKRNYAFTLEHVVNCPGCMGFDIYEDLEKN